MLHLREIKYFTAQMVWWCCIFAQSCTLEGTLHVAVKAIERSNEHFSIANAQTTTVIG